MIKTKIVSFLVAGVVGVSGTAAIIKMAWNGSENLSSSTTDISSYVKNTNESMSKAEAIIQKQNQEISKLQQENNELNSKVSSLNNENNKNKKSMSNLTNAIARLEGSSDYQNMTINQRENTVNTLLQDWGYSNGTISVVDKIFEVSEHWFLYSTPKGSVITDNKELIKGNNVKNKQ